MRRHLANETLLEPRSSRSYQIFKGYPEWVTIGGQAARTSLDDPTPLTG